MKCAIIAIEGLDVIDGRSQQVHLRQEAAAPRALNTFSTCNAKMSSNLVSTALEQEPSEQELQIWRNWYLVEVPRVPGKVPPGIGGGRCLPDAFLLFGQVSTGKVQLPQRVTNDRVRTGCCVFCLALACYLSCRFFSFLFFNWRKSSRKSQKE